MHAPAPQSSQPVEPALESVVVGPGSTPPLEPSEEVELAFVLDVWDWVSEDTPVLDDVSCGELVSSGQPARTARSVIGIALEIRMLRFIVSRRVHSE
jgi:hypothetical protein